MDKNLDIKSVIEHMLDFIPIIDEKFDHLDSLVTNIDLKKIDMFFKKLVNELNYNGLPRIADDNENVIACDFHGFMKYKYAYEFLKNNEEGDYWVGTGYEPGFFTTNNYHQAMGYTKGVRDKVVEFAIDREADGIRLDYLHSVRMALLKKDLTECDEEFREVLSVILNCCDEAFAERQTDPKTREEFIFCLAQYSVLAALFGYDYMVDPETENQIFKIFLNRGCLVVEKKTFERIEQAYLQEKGDFGASK